MTRTRLYLDVDGVLNADHPKNVWGDMDEGIALTEGTRYRIRWSPSLIERINALDVELVWTTTWRTDAPTTIQPLVGITLPEPRVLVPPEGHRLFPSIYWKRAAVEIDQERDPSPFVWIDDEMDMPSFEMATKLGGMMVTPDYSFGIRPREMDAVEAYIKNHPAPEAETPDTEA